MIKLISYAACVISRRQNIVIRLKGKFFMIFELFMILLSSGFFFFKGHRRITVRIFGLRTGAYVFFTRDHEIEFDGEFSFTESIRVYTFVLISDFVVDEITEIVKNCYRRAIFLESLSSKKIKRAK